MTFETRLSYVFGSLENPTRPIQVWTKDEGPAKSICQFMNPPPEEGVGVTHLSKSILANVNIGRPR